MADPVFEQLDDLALYALSSREQAAIDGYWAGYRPGPNQPLAKTISLTTAWQDGRGVYLFCARTFADAPRFLAAVDAWLAANSPNRDVRWLWVVDPDAAQLPVAVDIRAVSAGGGRWQTTRESRFVLSGYSLVLPAGVYLVQRLGDMVGFWIQDGLLQLVTPGQVTYVGGPSSATIPLIDGGLGAWEATIALGGSSPPLTGLAPQLRYAEAGAGTVVMPLLRPETPPTPAVGALTFDPLYPALPQRTAIGLRAVTGGQPPVLGSYLRTRQGYPVTLTPQSGPSPARLVFNVDAAAQHYLTADGAFALGTPAAEHFLALGLSSVEYVNLREEPAICRFVAGQPALAGDDGKLTGAATTAYVDLLPPAGQPGLVYYAQPELAPWFAVNTIDENGFLQSTHLPAATLPAEPGPGLPVGCYQGVAAADAVAAARLERAVLAPARRAGIGGAAPEGGELTIVTPQGILATATQGSAGWDRLVVGSFPDAAIKDLTFTGVSATLRGQWQASELFMVVAEPCVLRRNASVRYRVNSLVLRELLADGVPPDIVNLIAQRAPDTRVFETEQELRDAIEPVAADHVEAVLTYAGLFKLTMDGWTFQMSPSSWRCCEDSPTMMLVKFAGRTLRELIDEPEAWTWPEAASDKVVTHERLDAIMTSAQAADPDSPEGRFYREVVTDARWSGLLFLNVPIAAAELPEEMRFVTAGINPDRFYAHHVALSHTPLEVAGTTLRLGHTAASALIRYVDDKELAPTTTVSFEFVTQRLEVRFAGGAVVDMSARVQLLLNVLFGSRLTRLDPVGGNSLTITGSYQRQSEVLGYRFGLDRRAVYQTDGGALDTIEVLGVAVRTRRAPDDASTVLVDFGLEGNLRFAQLPDFDLFSYGEQRFVPPGAKAQDGYLRFADLTVTMAFEVTEPTEQTFTADEARLRVDLGNSKVRDGSLAAGFPVAVTGVVAVPSGVQRPEDLGYGPVLAPLDQVPLSAPWYGLTMRVDLGTLGSLADAASLSATLLAAWMPGRSVTDMPIYCGLKVPGPDDSGWPVQGVLRLGFRGYEFIVDRSGTLPAYMLRLQRLALSVLGWSFPPRRIDVLVFGDPNKPQASSVGWYAALPPPEE